MHKYWIVAPNGASCVDDHLEKQALWHQIDTAAQNFDEGGLGQKMIEGIGTRFFEPGGYKIEPLPTKQ